MKRFEAELLKDDWTQVRPDVEVKQIAIPQGEETYILYRTAGRKEKEKAPEAIFLKAWRRLCKLWRKALPAAD